MFCGSNWRLMPCMRRTRGTVFESKEVLVAKADSVLSGNRAAELDGLLDDAIVDPDGTLPHGRVVFVGYHERMEQAEPYMAEREYLDPAFIAKLMAVLHHLRQP